MEEATTNNEIQTVERDLEEQSAASQHAPTGEERRQALVAVAFDVIAAKGFEGLRVREVAARAGVNIATLHYYFPTKEALVRGVVEHLVQQFRTLATIGREEGGTALERLERHLIDLEQRLKTAPEMYIVLMEMQLRSVRDPAVNALLQETSVGWRAQITKLLQEGVQEGGFRADLDISEAVSIWIALIKGVATQELSRLDRFDFRRLGAFWKQWLGNPAMDVPATSAKKEKEQRRRRNNE